MLTSLFNGHLPSAILFDLDGTLIDSVPDLAYATDAMLVDLQLAPAGIEHVKVWVGNGAPKLVQRALAYAQGTSEAKLAPEEVTHALALFYQYYGNNSDRFSTLFSGVAETLGTLQLKGVRMCIITNKPQQFTPAVLAQHKLSHFFELVLSGDSLNQQKPDPAPLLYALEKMQLSKTEVVMVGDSSSDIEAANTAGIKSVCVSYGYNHGNDPKKLPASCHIDNFSQLLL